VSRSCMSCRTAVPNFSKFCPKCGVIYRDNSSTKPRPSQPTQSSVGHTSERPTQSWSPSSKKSTPSSGTGRNQLPTTAAQHSPPTSSPVTPPPPPGLQQPSKKESGGAGKWIVAVVLCFVAPPIGLLMIGYLVFFDRKKVEPYDNEPYDHES
jgi:hypothetical protein